MEYQKKNIVVILIFYWLLYLFIILTFLDLWKKTRKLSSPINLLTKFHCSSLLTKKKRKVLLENIANSGIVNIANIFTKSYYVLGRTSLDNKVLLLLLLYLKFT